ncbi:MULTISPECIES: hypothetical protein [Sphingobacterium]|jgi:hypothetical protein|uniref:hypothetical protein n=1 Tax=Sphingobacterium TaxID=28453 RepID=UPI0028AB4A7E|nr:hypothetical protein [Sphingobacterium multivorum]
MKQTKTTEHFKFEFLGIKVDSSNPGKKSILILLFVLVFIGYILFLFKDYLIPFAELSCSKWIVSKIKGIR